MNKKLSLRKIFSKTGMTLLTLIAILAIALPASGAARAEEVTPNNGANPRIVGNIPGDWFWVSDFTPGTLALAIYEAPGAEAPLWFGSQAADGTGFLFVEPDDHGVDLVAGNTIVVSDGVNEKALTLEPITIEVFDLNNEIMAGTAQPGREVWAAAGPQAWQEFIPVTADPLSGSWQVDFKSIGFDIIDEFAPWSYAHVYDEDGDANEASTPAPPPSTWRDEFSEAINSGWYWKNGADAWPWSLSDAPGSLRMIAANSPTPYGNLLLRNIANGDFSIETRMIFEPDNNYQIAGLVLWQDDNNFLQFGRAFCDNPEFCVGNGIYFDKVLDGYTTDSNFTTPVDELSEASLRLERRGELVRALYSGDGVTWFEIGTHRLPPEFQVNAAGLMASQDFFTDGPYLPADFDYFELNEGWSFLPEGFHDSPGGDVPTWDCHSSGWAADPDERAVDLNVNVLLDGSPFASLVAADFRQDLLDSGVCEDGYCSFSMPLWGLISAYEQHTMEILAQDTATGYWVRLSASPKDMTCRSYDIYSYDPLTGATTQVTHIQEADEYNPSWSPNGKKVTHDVFRADGSYGIYITDVANGLSTLLVEGGNDAVWSPNGKWIAFDRAWTETPNIYLVPAAGGSPILAVANAMSPDWAPSGKRLVYKDPSTDQILTAPVDGGKGVVTLVADYGWNPVWSPDGNWIAYDDGNDIWKVWVNSLGKVFGSPVQVTSGALINGQPTWSPDSQTIAYHSGFNADWDLWTVPASGGMGTWLTGALIYGDYDPSYAKNSGKVAYASFSPNGQSARDWVAAFTYDLPAGFWSPGEHSYQFRAGEGGDTDLKILNVNEEAVLYEDLFVLLRPYYILAPLEGMCQVNEMIHPDQATRFQVGYTSPDKPYLDAVAELNFIAPAVTWDGGDPLPLDRHEIIPFNQALDWFGYVCTFTNP